MQALARFFSTILSPLLMPTYGIFLVLWVSILCYLPTGTRLVVLLVVFGITCILPMIFSASQPKDYRRQAAYRQERANTALHSHHILLYRSRTLSHQHTHAAMGGSVRVGWRSSLCHIADSELLVENKRAYGWNRWRAGFPCASANGRT